MRAKLPPRVLGPYQGRDKWGLIIVENGQKENQIYATQEEALRMQWKLANAVILQTRTVESAINEWQEERRQIGTSKALTLDQQATRVRFMLCDHLQKEQTRITSKKAELLYEKYQTNGAATTIRAAEQARHRASASTMRRLLKSPAMANLLAQMTSSGLEMNIGVEQMPTDPSGFNRGGGAPGQGGDQS